jgi:hypothetical protein
MAAKKKEYFMQEAVKRPGALTRKAKRAGKSISEYCAGGGHDTRTKRQCNLAKTFRKFRPKGRRRGRRRTARRR